MNLGAFNLKPLCYLLSLRRYAEDEEEEEEVVVAKPVQRAARAVRRCRLNTSG